MDVVQLLLQILLLCVGIAFIYGAGQEVGGDFASMWKRQVGWALCGLLFFFTVVLFDYRLLGRWSWALYGLGLLLLALVFPFGAELNNAKSWLKLPGTAIRIQPAELAKPATLVFIAWLASRPFFRHSHVDLLALPAFLAVSVPVLLIALQPDYGTALVFFPFTFAIVFAAGLSWRWILPGFALVLIAAPLVYPRLAPHQRDRIKVFLEPPADGLLAMTAPLLPANEEAALMATKERFFKRSTAVIDTDWNAHQSLLAVGSGGLWGKGFMHGTQHVLGFLPRTVAPTDFIFSVIAEETGFVGAGAVLCAFMGLILCMVRTALLASDDFGSYLACGVAVFFFTHVFINVGMTMRATPIIGIPLPFVSYGGSFMLGTMLCAGLAQSVHVRRGLEREDDA